MMAVAVRVTVVTLGTRVVGCFLQSHEHVHLQRHRSSQLFVASGRKSTSSKRKLQWHSLWQWVTKERKKHAG